jgi:hypothetical protein
LVGGWLHPAHFVKIKASTTERRKMIDIQLVRISLDIAENESDVLQTFIAANPGIPLEVAQVIHWRVTALDLMIVHFEKQLKEIPVPV